MRDAILEQMDRDYANLVALAMLQRDYDRACNRLAAHNQTLRELP